MTEIGGLYRPALLAFPVESKGEQLEAGFVVLARELKSLMTSPGFMFFAITLPNFNCCRLCPAIFSPQPIML